MTQINDQAEQLQWQMYFDPLTLNEVVTGQRDPGSWRFTLRFPGAYEKCFCLNGCRQWARLPDYSGRELGQMYREVCVTDPQVADDIRARIFREGPTSAFKMPAWFQAWVEEQHRLAKI